MSTANTAASLQRARDAVTAFPFYSSEQIIEMWGGSVTNAHLARMRRNASLLSLRFVRRGYLYPAFQFDPIAGRVHPTVMLVNRRLCVSRPVPDALLWWHEVDRNHEQPRFARLDDGPALLAEIQPTAS